MAFAGQYLRTLIFLVFVFRALDAYRTCTQENSSSRTYVDEPQDGKQERSTEKTRTFYFHKDFINVQKILFDVNVQMWNTLSRNLVKLQVNTLPHNITNWTEKGDCFEKTGKCKAPRPRYEATPPFNCSQCVIKAIFNDSQSAFQLKNITIVSSPCNPQKSTSTNSLENTFFNATTMSTASGKDEITTEKNQTKKEANSLSTKGESTISLVTSASTTIYTSLTTDNETNTKGLTTIENAISSVSFNISSESSSQPSSAILGIETVRQLSSTKATTQDKSTDTSKPSPTSLTTENETKTNGSTTIEDTMYSVTSTRSTIVTTKGSSSVPESATTTELSAVHTHHQTQSNNHRSLRFKQTASAKPRTKQKTTVKNLDKTTRGIRVTPTTYKTILIGSTYLSTKKDSGIYVAGEKTNVPPDRAGHITKGTTLFFESPLFLCGAGALFIAICSVVLTYLLIRKMRTKQPRLMSQNKCTEEPLYENIVKFQVQNHEEPIYENTRLERVSLQKGKSKIPQLQPSTETDSEVVYCAVEFTKLPPEIDEKPTLVEDTIYSTVNVL